MAIYGEMAIFAPAAPLDRQPRAPSLPARERAVLPLRSYSYSYS
jgi:hypothetical protein